MMNVLVSFQSMMRGRLAILAVLLLSGFLPLTSGFGFCAAKPCCRHHNSDVVSLTTLPACCNETNCARATRDTEATNATSIHLQSHLVVTPMTASLAPPVVTLARGVLAFESPPMSRRLAALSILLI